ncbi:WD40 repeat domain-containing protein [Nocardia sp. NPDC058519]|uniref:WD40 repeat domain-containing protein n=1 Tax=Nocardia sp. NPDC058519 TaxID=3346535 RepID=UPI0036462285
MYLYSLACSVLDGRSVALVGTVAGVRIWDVASGSPIGEHLVGHSGGVTAVACTELGGRQIAVTGSSDQTVQVWDLATGSPIGEPLRGHTYAVYSVACIDVHGRPVAVTVGSCTELRVWDIETGTVIGEAPEAKSELVFSVACGALDGRPVAITGGFDKVCVWDLATCNAIDEVPSGRAAGLEVSEIVCRPTGLHAIGRRLRLNGLLRVNVVACTEIDGRPVAVTGSNDKTVRLWDLDAGTAIGTPLHGHTEEVTAVACTEIDGRPVAVTGSNDKTVRLWDLDAGTAIGKPLRGHTEEVTAVACTEIDGRPVAITGSGLVGDEIRVWDLADGTLIHRIGDHVIEQRVGRTIVIPYHDGTTHEAVLEAAAGLIDSAVVQELVTIGTTRSFLRDDRARAVEIGQQLNEEGGINLMRAVHAAVASRIRLIPGRARELEMAWSGIGDWLA